MTADSAQEPGGVMILASEPAVLIQLFGNVNLVTGATKLRSLVNRFQVGFLVKRRLRLDQLSVDPGE